MLLLDLSQPVWDASPNCPAHAPVKVQTTPHSGDPLDSWQIEHLDFASHTGSHLDAPLHKIAGGRSLSEMPLDSFAGRAFALDLRPLAPDAPLNAAMLDRLPAQARGHVVLLCTGWGERRAQSEEWLYHSPRLTPDGAQFLVERGVRGVGIDHYSVGGASEPNNAQTHEILLGAGVWILEELLFPDELWSWPQPLRFMALPINLRGASGAPCGGKTEP